MAAINPGIWRTPLQNIWLGNDDVTTEETTVTIARLVGITHIVSLVSPPCAKRLPNISYLDLPLRDNDAALAAVPVLKRFRAADDWIKRVQSNDGNAGILIHCAEARSRSPSLIIYMMMRRTYMSYETAFVILRAFRPRLNPNPTFIRVLRQYGCSFVKPKPKDWFLLKTHQNHLEHKHRKEYADILCEIDIQRRQYSHKLSQRYEQ
jgi:predicted protein tyrosine phosphatase